MASISFIPKEWRRLSWAQKQFLQLLLDHGPVLVTKRTRRSAEVLYRRGLIEHDHARLICPEHQTYYCTYQPIRLGKRVRASGAGWELFREFQRLQGRGDAFILAMRESADV